MSTYKQTATVVVDGKSVGVDVLTGWDPVFKRFFLVITDDNRDDYVYTNLSDPQLKEGCAEYNCITYFEKKAQSFGITLNPETLKKLMADQTKDS